MGRMTAKKFHVALTLSRGEYDEVYTAMVWAEASLRARAIGLGVPAGNQARARARMLRAVIDRLPDVER